MRFKSALVALLAPIVVHGETLQEFVEKNGAKTPGNDIRDPFAYNLIYPVPKEKEIGKPYLPSGIEITLQKRYVLEQTGRIKSSTATLITVYILKKTIVKDQPSFMLERIVLTDPNSNGICEEGEGLLFEGKSLQRYQEINSAEEIDKLFHEIYTLAEEYCGLRKDKEENVRTYSANKSPVKS